MTYIIVKAKDIPNWKTEYDEFATCGDIIINCDLIVRMESYINKDKRTYPYDNLVLHMLDGKRFILSERIPIETNWDLIMSYHKKSTRIEL